MVDVSLVDDVVQEEEGVSLVGEAPVPVVTPEKVKERAGKAHFALGERYSPGLLALEEQYAAGNGSAVSKMAKQKRIDEQLSGRNRLVSEYLSNRLDPSAPLSEQEAADIQAVNSSYPKVDENVTLEQQFAERYHTTAMSKAMVENEELDAEYNEDPVTANNVMDFHIKDQTTVQLIHNQLDVLESRDDSVGKIVSDYIEKLVPFKETYEIFSLDEDVPGAEIPDTELLPGKNLQEKFNHFYSLPNEAQAELLPRIVEALAARNTLTAASFLTRLLSYSASDSRFDTMMGSLDLVEFTPLGIASGVVKGAGIAAASKAIMTGSLRRPLGVSKALDDIGDVAESAFVNSKQRIIRKANNLPETEKVEDIFNTVPSLFNPDSIISGSNSSLSALDQSRLLTLFKKNAHKFMDATNDTLAIQRLRSGDFDGVLDAVRTQMTLDFPRLEDKIIDVRLINRSSDTLTNNDVMEVMVGNLDGELFTTKKAAEQHAKNVYELPKGWEARREGARWGIFAKTTVDETAPAIRKLELSSAETTPQTGSYVRELIRRFETPEDSFSVAGRDDRRIGVQGASRLLGLTRAADDVFRSLPKKSRNNLSSFLNKEKRYIDPDGNHGRFAADLGELQDRWRKEFNRSPTPNEVAGYFTYGQLSDMDWVIRNNSALGGKLRKNVRNATISLPNKNNITLEGASASPDNITSETAGVFVMRANGQHQYIRTNSTLETQTVKDLHKAGYQMIQVSPKGQAALGADKRFKKFIGSGEVNFVLSKNVKLSRLEPKQIDYTPGGHVVYDSGSFVVQPKMYREFDPNSRSLVGQHYQGDNSLLWFRSQAEAKKYAPKIEEARKIVKDGLTRGGKLTDDATLRLKQYLETELPIWNVGKFKNLFQEFNDTGVFSLSDPFTTTEWGKNSATFNKLSEKYHLFRDSTNSSYNLYSELNQKFLSERSAPLLTIKETGGQNTPLLRLDRAPILDAFPSLERGLNSLIDNVFLDDLKINAANRFVKEFGELLEPSKDRMLSNPIPHLYNPRWRSNVDPAKRRVAENYIRSTKELLNVDNQTNRVLNRMRENLKDSVFRTYGQDGVERVANSAAYGAIKEPTAFMREMAFHLTLGLFNPVQLFVQGTTFVHIAALAGTRNSLAAGPGAWMMQMARQTTEPDVLAGIADKATAFGWKKDHWLEANEMLQRSGFGVMGRDQALLDDAFNPQFLTTRTSRALDGAAFFFNAIERAIRHQAYAAAYRKWRTSNLTAKVTPEVENLILSDAQKFTVDMTGNANAMWQKGWGSIPTQFWSYATRMSEQMLSKRLTGKEKARLMAFYGGVFGVPTVGSIATTFPFSDQVRDYLNSQGTNVDDTVYETFRDGIVATTLEGLTGTDFDISGRLSPEGLGPGQLLKDLFSDDKTTWELLIGVGGGKLGQTLADAFSPVHRHLMSLSVNSENAPWVSHEEARQVLANVSSFSQLEKLYFALNYEAYYTKKGRLTAYNTPEEGVISALTGFTPDYIAQTYSIQRVTQSQKDYQNKVRNQVAKEYQSMLRSLQVNDVSGAEKAERAAAVWLQVGGFTPDQEADIYNNISSNNKELLEQLDDAYIDMSMERRLERAGLLDHMKSERDKELGITNGTVQ